MDVDAIVACVAVKLARCGVPRSRDTVTWSARVLPVWRGKCAPGTAGSVVAVRVIRRI